ncbi:hypothetical protein LTR82_018101 [Friedmanniomyces endolithicus]|uniref:Fungal N-terminal domain-containing protein n=1 Tax=Friedmanniomyces endolithicus TaxID=329885 RepID=A0AAN6F3G6_9PEZI|nr:hypothetical protein LTR82_018101 [Friedmanniomyces endolithicus]
METQDTFIPSDTYHSSATGVKLSATPSGMITARALTECRDRIAVAKAELKNDLNAPLRALTNTLPNPIEDDPEVARVKKWLEFCDEALRNADHHRTNLYEDVSVADDSQQYIVSTIGDLICAKRVTTGSRSVIVMGQMSDESLQRSFLHLGRGQGFERSSPHSPDETRRSAFTQHGKGQYVGKNGGL